MAIQFKDTIRNGRLDAIETVGGASCALRVYTGTQPSDVTQANSGTLLATILLPADWLANAATDVLDDDTNACILAEFDIHYQVEKTGTATEIPAV